MGSLNSAETEEAQITDGFYIMVLLEESIVLDFPSCNLWGYLVRIIVFIKEKSLEKESDKDLEWSSRVWNAILYDYEFIVTILTSD